MTKYEGALCPKCEKLLSQHPNIQVSEPGRVGNARPCARCGKRKNLHWVYTIVFGVVTMLALFLPLPAHAATAAEKQLMYMIVEAEAGDMDYTARVAVANCICNRLNSGSFGDSLHKVMTAKGQFTHQRPKPTKDSIRAVDDCLAGCWVISDQAHYFYDYRMLSRSPWASSRYVDTVGFHKFYK